MNLIGEEKKNLLFSHEYIVMKAYPQIFIELIFASSK